MSQLLEYLNEVRDAKFAWGEHDCALFSAKYWDRKYGTQFSQMIRSLGVKSARDYRRLLRSGVSLESMTTEAIGQPVLDTPKEGDVVLVRTIKGSVLGIAVPPVALCAAEVGFQPVPLGCASRVWRPSCLK